MLKPKVCVVYYSLSGNTKLVAKTISEELCANLIDIKPKKELKSNGLMRYFWAGKQVFMKELPEINHINEQQFDDYDLIIIGTPVWAYNLSPPVRAFLSKNSLKNKKIAVFCTCGGNKGNTLLNMKKELTKSRVMGEESFLKVKDNRQASIDKAKIWAKSLVSSI